MRIAGPEFPAKYSAVGTVQPTEAEDSDEEEPTSCRWSTHEMSRRPQLKTMYPVRSTGDELILQWTDR